MPSFVVADAAYKVYPGGVIVLRAVDWMAGARGTLSSETDTRSVAGQVVRDSQKVTTSIFSAGTVAFEEADDTLVVDISAVPFENDLVLSDMTYFVFASILIEGDWDMSDPDMARGSTQHTFLYECRFGFYGDPLNSTTALREELLTMPRLREHYTIVQFGSAMQANAADTLYFRAYAQDGSSIEWLIDQIYFIPVVTSGTKMGEWRVGDFVRVGPLLTNTSLITDGGDGGDGNGKFTWQPLALETHTSFTGGDGGGDYQQKAGEATSEYVIRIPDDDFYYLANTEPVPDIESNAYLYSLHGVNNRGSDVFTLDEFTRTVGGGPGSFNWGLTPENFGWRIFYNSSPGSFHADSRFEVDGSKGVMFIVNSTLNALGQMRALLSPFTGDAVDPLGAWIVSDQLEASGLLTITDGPSTILPPTGSSPRADAEIRFLIGDISYHYILLIDFLNLEWTLLSAPTEAGTRYTIYGPVDISGWLTLDEPIGFRMEIRRYLLRVKVWQSSGGEPGAWDFENFRPLYVGATRYDYSYGDDLDRSMLEADGLRFGVHWFVDGIFGGLAAHWDNLQLEVENTGTAASMHSYVEQPDQGAEVAQIEIPAGPWQLVYWGSRDWTIADGFGGFYVDFAGKVWNETTAPDLQRAEAPFYYFRSIHYPYLVPMNWRSSTREGGWKRVLKGNT